MRCKCGKAETVLVRGGNSSRCDRCNRALILNECLINLHVPKVFHDSRLSDFKSKCDTKASLFISGPVGCGKSHLAVALLVNDILETPMNRSLNVDFISMVNLLARIKSTFSKTSKETEDELIGHFCNIPNLYIDDLGVEQASEWALVRAYQIIDHRWGNNLRTVFTSNFDLDSLAEKMDPRIASRIRGMCDVIQMNGKDRRQK